MKICKAVVDDARCERKLVANGYCDPHYRQDKNGEPFRAIRPTRPMYSTLIRNDAGEKSCKYCDQWKPVSSFHKSSSTADKLQIFCTQCNKDYANKHHEDNPLNRRRRDMFKRYGVTLEEFDELLEGQGGSCAICNGGQGNRQWQMDHDHATGLNRGVLCWRCNITLGNVEDRIDILHSMIGYLEKWGNN